MGGLLTVWGWVELVKSSLPGINCIIREEGVCKWHDWKSSQNKAILNKLESLRIINNNHKNCILSDNQAKSHVLSYAARVLSFPDIVEPKVLVGPWSQFFSNLKKKPKKQSTTNKRRKKKNKDKDKDEDEQKNELLTIALLSDILFYIFFFTFSFSHLYLQI